MSTANSNYHVRAVQCDYQADDEEVYQSLKRATAPLIDVWEKLGRAQRIGIKFNQDKEPHRQITFAGQLQQLVCENVARAVLRLLREKTSAELICADVSFYAVYGGADLKETTTVAPLLREFDVEYIDGTHPPYKTCSVPGGGQMFRQYLLPQGSVEVDEFVSVATMKNHGFMGITLALKNLFGLMATQPHGHARPYFHHLVRMPYMLADLGRIFDPALNIVDGLVGQAGQEWGDGDKNGPARVGNSLIAGNQIIATDACAAHLMGHDPQSDWLTPPFHRDRNALLTAAEAGFGTVNLQEIDFQTEVESPVAEFFSNLTDSREKVISWRRTTCEQALYYRDNQRQLTDKYAGEYILLQENEVRWHDKDSNLRQSRRKLSGGKPEQAMWLKYVDPEETEGEHFDVYERALAHIEKTGI